MNIAIFGFGLEGRSSLNFLLDQGILPSQLTIVDQYAKPTDIDPQIKIFQEEITAHNLDSFDIIFRTAGASPFQECFRGIEHKLTTQTQFFFDNYTGPIIAITGTKGKSTTTELTYLTLKNAEKDVLLAGNIGLPLLEQVKRGHTYDYVIMEISSYQLEGLSAKFDIGILLNLYPEHHADRHGSMDNYYQAKLGLIRQSNTRIIGSQIASDHPEYYTEINNGDSHLFGPQSKYSYENDQFQIDGENIFADTDMLLRGEHNRYNACATLAVCDIVRIDPQYLHQTLQTYSGLPHRLQDLGIIQDIRWIDDAIATTPQSTIAALDTFGEEVDTIFLGGKDGGYDFTELVEKLDQYKVSNIVLFPDSGKHIKVLLDPDQYSIFGTRDMSEAVNFAFQNTTKNKIALLSCASPSYSIRKNFEEKGDLFQQSISNL